MPATVGALVVVIVLVGSSLLGASAAVPPATPAPAVISGEATRLMVTTVKATDGSLSGGSLLTQSGSSGIVWQQSMSFGFGGKDRTVAMGTDSCIGMNTMSELLIAYAAVKLQADTKFVDSLDATVQGDFAPGGLTMANPGNNLPISYKMLMTHTSTISDSLFLARQANTPSTVGSLTNWVEQYFVSPGPRLNRAAFNTNLQPGSASSFVQARANTALLAYALERALRGQPRYNGLKDYIAQEILTPFGMGSTFFLEVDGSAPGLTPPPSFTGERFTSLTTASAAVYAPYFQGCIVDQFQSTVPIHPAWPADFMGYTTSSDMARFAFRLFVDQTSAAVSNLALVMRERRSVLSGTPRHGQTGQGLGLMFFNGDVLCGSGLATKVIAQCPLTNASVIYGYASNRGGSSVGFFCTESTTVIGDVVCVSVANVHSGATPATFDALFALASAAFQEQFGVLSVSTPAPTLPFRNEDETQVYGVLVFVGTYVTLLFIFFGTMLLQYLLLPAAIPPATSTGAIDLDKDGKPVDVEKQPNYDDGPKFE